MKIALVAPSPVPFAIGGAENLWYGLLTAFNALPGVQADLIKLPSPERNFDEILASYRAFLHLDLSHFDQIISTKYPAWMVRHPNHVVYLQHTLRGLYDTYPSHLSTALPPGLPLSLQRLLQAPSLSPAQTLELLDSAAAAHRSQALPPEYFALPGPVLRALVHALDRHALAPGRIRKYFAISRTVASRADYFPPGIAPTVLHHPTSLVTHPGSSQSCIFTASRLDGPKRIDLLIQAYQRSGIALPFVIAGSGPDEARLKNLAAGSRVQFVGRLTDAELATHYAQACFVPFAPQHEDYGLITLEAMQSGKPVITTRDAGGVTELVRHGETGLITEPTPEALATAMQQLATDPGTAAAMGAKGQECVAPIRWDSVAGQLLCPPESTPGQLAAPHLASSPRPRILVANTFPVWPPTTGGQQRIYHLYRHLARHADIELIVPTQALAQTSANEIAPGLTERRIPVSPALAAVIQELDQDTGASCGDIAFALFPHLNGQLEEAIVLGARSAHWVVASHPYTHPLLPTLDDKPLIYDAHNVEWDLKRSIYGHSPWIDLVRDVEAACAQGAQRIMACSDDDAQRLAALYDLPRETLVTVPNGVDLAGIRQLKPGLGQALARPPGQIRRPIALFIGANHHPNQLAARFLHKLAPQVPDWDFVIAGSVCHAVHDEPPQPNLRLLGILSDSQKSAWLTQADVGLNPVITGSGTNLKLMEYLAHGLHVVSSPFGARGLHLPPEHLTLAEQEDFPRALQALAPRLQSPDSTSPKGIDPTLDWGHIALHAWSSCFQPCLA